MVIFGRDSVVKSKAPFETCFSSNICLHYDEFTIISEVTFIASLSISIYSISSGIFYNNSSHEILLAASGTVNNACSAAFLPMSFALGNIPYLIIS